MSTSNPLPQELQDFLSSVQPLNEIDLNRLEKGVERVFNTPDFKADLLKCKFVEKVTAVMNRAGISKSELARRLGKTRQYLSKLLDHEDPNNFTIDTMVELTHHVGAELDISVHESSAYVWLSFDWHATNARWDFQDDAGFARVSPPNTNMTSRLSFRDECALSA